MIPYYILVLFPIALSAVRFKNEDNEQKKRRTITLFFVLLIMLLALRAPTIGIDLPNYRYIFLRTIQNGWDEIGNFFSEPAWFALNKVVGFFTTDFQWLLIVTALISVISVFLLYRKSVESPALTISLFITTSNFVMLFSGLRQAVAVSLGVIAYEFTKKQKLIPYLLTVLGAFLFHKSAFMLLFMYPLYHVRITKKWLWFVIPIMAVIFVFNEPIFGALTLIISDYYEGTISNTGAYTMLILLFLFCIFSFIIPDEKKLNEETIGMRNFLLFVTAIQMFAPLNSLAMRMGYYYLIFIPLLIPKIIKFRSKKWNQVAVLSKYVMIAFFIVYFFIDAPISNSLETFPYHFFWENI